jgi:hypothetical protein
MVPMISALVKVPFPPAGAAVGVDVDVTSRVLLGLGVLNIWLEVPPCVTMLETAVVEEEGGIAESVRQIIDLFFVQSVKRTCYWA